MKYKKLKLYQFKMKQEFIKSRLRKAVEPGNQINRIHKNGKRVIKRNGKRGMQYDAMRRRRKERTWQNKEKWKKYGYKK